MAGAAPLARGGSRFSHDIDLFHDRELAMQTAMELGAVIWAGSAKDPGLSPEGIIAEIRRNGRYQQADYDRLQIETPVDAAATAQALRAVLNEADEFVRAMPAGQKGMLFLQAGRPVQPDPLRLDHYVVHGGQERGHWPTSGDITRAMLDRFESLA